MIVRFPPLPANIQDSPFWRQVIFILEQSFQQVASRRFAQDRVFLRSPDGTTYELTVDNAGTLSTAANDGNELD